MINLNIHHNNISTIQWKLINNYYDLHTKIRNDGIIDSKKFSFYVRNQHNTKVMKSLITKEQLLKKLIFLLTINNRRVHYKVLTSIDYIKVNGVGVIIIRYGT